MNEFLLDLILSIIPKFVSVMFADLVNKFLNAVNPRNCFGAGLYGDIFEDQREQRAMFAKRNGPQLEKPEEASTSVESWNNAFDSAGSDDVEDDTEFAGLAKSSEQSEDSAVEPFETVDSVEADSELINDMDTVSICTAIEIEDTPEVNNTDFCNQQSPSKQCHFDGFRLKNIATHYKDIYYTGDFVMNSRNSTKTTFEDTSIPGSRIQLNFNKKEHLLSIEHGDKLYHRFEELPSRVADMLVSARAVSRYIGIH